jgi:hypothetical protein
VDHASAASRTESGETASAAPRRADGIERIYIRCCARARRRRSTLWPCAINTGWRCIEIKTPHLPSITHPHIVTDALAEIPVSP